MKFLIVNAKLLGASQIMLKVKKDNNKAKKLYEKFGFTLKELDNDFLKGTLEL